MDELLLLSSLLKSINKHIHRLFFICYISDRSSLTWAAAQRLFSTPSGLYIFSHFELYLWPVLLKNTPKEKNKSFSASNEVLVGSYVWKPLSKRRKLGGSLLSTIFFPQGLLFIFTQLLKLKKIKLLTLLVSTTKWNTVTSFQERFTVSKGAPLPLIVWHDSYKRHAKGTTF